MCVYLSQHYLYGWANDRDEVDGMRQEDYSEGKEMHNEMREICDF